MLGGAVLLVERRSCRPLAARDLTVDEIRQQIGADSLAYISLVGLEEATTRSGDSLCRACLTREYPTRVPADTAKLRFETV